MYMFYVRREWDLSEQDQELIFAACAQQFYIYRNKSYTSALIAHYLINSLDAIKFASPLTCVFFTSFLIHCKTHDENTVKGEAILIATSE